MIKGATLQKKSLKTTNTDERLLSGIIIFVKVVLQCLLEESQKVLRGQLCMIMRRTTMLDKRQEKKTNFSAVRGYSNPAGVQQ